MSEFDDGCKIEFAEDNDGDMAGGGGCTAELLKAE